LATWFCAWGAAILPVCTWLSTCSALLFCGLPASKPLPCTRRKYVPCSSAPLMSLV